MVKFWGWWLSWALFYVGDFVSDIMHFFHWWWLYPVYNKTMSWSVGVQDWANVKGPWEKNNGN
jgi:hypothetical protein